MSEQEWTQEERRQIEAYKEQISQWDWVSIRAKVNDIEAIENGMPEMVCLGLQRELLPSGRPLPSVFLGGGVPEDMPLPPPPTAEQIEAAEQQIPLQDRLWMAAVCEVMGPTVQMLTPGDVHESGEPSIWLEWSGEPPV